MRSPDAAPVRLKGECMRRLFRDYSLGIVLFGVFLVSWVAQSYFGWQEFVANQREHQQTAHFFGADGYLWSWGAATFENWQSEFLQLFAMVALTSFLLFKGSPESKDGDEEMKQTLARLEQRLEELARRDYAANGNGVKRLHDSDLSPVGATGD